MQRKVYLEGEIGDRFGHEFDMNVTSFGEVIACLETNFPEFRQYLMDSDEKGVGFTCQVNSNYIQEEEELLLHYNEGDMVISAIPAGSGGGFGKILGGLLLIGLAFAPFFTPVITAAGLGAGLSGGMALAIAGGLKMAVIGLGLNMALSGVQELLAPDPSVDVQQDESYLFQGAGQTILEGDPVPVVYGKLRVPGRPISFEIKNAERQFTDYAQVGYDYVEPNDNGGPKVPTTSPDTTKTNSQQGDFSSL